MSNLAQSHPHNALVTGATSGIGRAVAKALATAGVSVGIVARDAGRGEAVRTEIATGAGDGPRLFVADLSSMAAVGRLAAEVGEACPHLDLIVHCAAVYLPRRIVTVDGLESMFATNVLAPFLLTNLLLGPLRAAGAARVLVLSAPSTVKLDFDDLQGERRFRALTSFGATKAADLILVNEFARRLHGSGVTFNAVHPGLVRSNLMRQAPAPLRWATRLVSRSAQSAAAAIVPLALSADYAGRTGLFLHHGREIDPPPYTRDPEIGDRLWAACASLTGLEPARP